MLLVPAAKRKVVRPKGLWLPNRKLIRPKAGVGDVTVTSFPCAECCGPEALPPPDIIDCDCCCNAGKDDWYPPLEENDERCLLPDYLIWHTSIQGQSKVFSDFCNPFGDCNCNICSVLSGTYFLPRDDYPDFFDPETIISGCKWKKNYCPIEQSGYPCGISLCSTETPDLPTGVGQDTFTYGKNGHVFLWLLDSTLTCNVAGGWIEIGVSIEYTVGTWTTPNETDGELMGLGSHNALFRAYIPNGDWSQFSCSQLGELTWNDVTPYSVTELCAEENLSGFTYDIGENPEGEYGSDETFIESLGAGIVEGEDEDAIRLKISNSLDFA